MEFRMKAWPSSLKAWTKGWTWECELCLFVVLEGGSLLGRFLYLISLNSVL